MHILLQLKLADMADLQCQQLKDNANTVKIKVENEKHLILYCPLYKSIRNNFDSLFLNASNSGEENAI